MSKIKVDEIESQSGSTVTITGSPSISGDISVANVNASQDVTATGDVSGANVSATTDVSTGTVTATGAISGASATVTGAISGASATVTGAVSADTVSATTSVDTASVTATDVNSTDVTATGAVSGDTVSGTTSVTTATVNATTGAITTVNATDVNSTDVTATGSVSGDAITGTTSVDTATVTATTGAITTVNATDVNSTDVTATGTVSGNAVSSTTSVSADTVSATTSVDTATVNATDVTATGTVSGNAVSSTTSLSGASASITGDVSAGTFTGDGSALTGVTKADQDLDTTDDVNFNTVTAVGTITANAFSGDGSALTGIGGGATAQERTAIMDLMMRQAEDDFDNSRTEIDFYGGHYDVFVNEDKITNKTGDINYDSVGVDGFVAVKPFQNIGDITIDQVNNPFGESLRAISWDSGTKRHLYTQNTSRTRRKYEVNADFTLSGLTEVQNSGLDDIYSLTFDQVNNRLYGVNSNFQQFAKYGVSADGTANIASRSEFFFSTYGFPDMIEFHLSGDGTKLMRTQDNIQSTQIWELNTPGVIESGYSSYLGDVRHSEGSFALLFTDDGLTAYGGINQGTVYQYSFSTPYGGFGNVSPTLVSSNNDRGGDEYQWADGNNILLSHRGGTLLNHTLLNSTLSGTFDSSIDLSDALSSAPTKVVVTADSVNQPNDVIRFTVSDGTNTVLINKEDFDTQIDCSSLTSTSLTVTVLIDPDSTTATNVVLKSYALYFK